MTSARDGDALRSEVSSIEPLRSEATTYPLNGGATAGEARFASARDSEALRSEVSSREALRSKVPDYPLNDGAKSGETSRVLERLRIVAF